MKLSEAIRLGAMLKPQGRDFYHTPQGTCALGAAADAIGLDEMTLGLFDLEAKWPHLTTPGCPACPVCGWASYDLFGLIAHLNDEEEWTRERIADWVATVEPTETTASDHPIVEPAEVRG